MYACCFFAIYFHHFVLIPFQLIKEYPNLNLFNIHENLIECYLAAQQYADAQAFLLKYDGNVICSTFIIP